MRPVISVSDRESAMNALGEEVQHDLSLPLALFREHEGYVPVIGEGSLEARLVIVGEAPGENEARTGRPFCGRSGELLDRLFSAAGMERDQVYITNLVKDRPPENRDPTREEIAAYAPLLLRQMGIVKPSTIATLGRFSAAAIFSAYAPDTHFTSIGDMHGRLIEGRAQWGTLRIVPLYHPAAALYNPALYPVLEADFVRMAQSM